MAPSGFGESNDVNREKKKTERGYLKLSVTLFTRILTRQLQLS